MDKATCDTIRKFPNARLRRRTVRSRPLNFEFFGKLAARGSERRSESAHKHGKRQCAGGEEQRSHVQAGGEDDRKLPRGKRREQEPAGPLAHGESGQRSGDREQRALREELANHAPAAGSHRQTHGEFTLACHAAREQ